MQRKTEWTAVVLTVMVAGLLSGCVRVVTPLAPGSSLIEDSNQGLVFGRVGLLRDGGDLLTVQGPFRRRFGWQLLQEGSGKQFVVDPLTTDGWFVVSLPAGHYRVTKITYFSEHSGLWEGRVPARFGNKAGASTYLGTWEIEFTPLGGEGKVSTRVLNEIDNAQGELNRFYTGPRQSIVVGLLESDKEGYFSLLEPADK